MTKITVGFIGLGSQGGPMARRIVESGYPLLLWARRAGNARPSTRRQSRCQHGRTGRALPTTSVFASWTTRVTGKSAASSSPAMRPGSRIAIHSTVHPRHLSSSWRHKLAARDIALSMLP